MAEKRRAGFNIPLNFYDGPEVESIPKRIRAAAIGVWALAGDYAATQLTDGYVPAGILRMFGCTDIIRAALKVTVNKKGELSPLWVDAPGGAIRLTNWEKWQRTNDEVTTYRAAEAERKRLARAAKGNGTNAYLDGTNAELTPNLRDNYENSGANLNANPGLIDDLEHPSTPADLEMSDRTKPGRPPDVRQTSGQPKTETETETKREGFGYVPESASLSNARDSIAATPGADLVRELIPATIPDSERTMLRIKASGLLREGSSREDVREGLRLYLAKPHLGAGALPALVSEAVRIRAAPGTNGKPVHKMRAVANLAARQRAAENAQTNGLKELE